MTPRSLAALIRAHRRAAHLTLAELAAASGVSVRTIGDLERGRSTARQSTLDALAGALGLDVDARAVLAAAARAARAGWAGPATDVVAGAARAGFAVAREPTLPRDVPDFIGRAAELGALARHMNDAVPVLVHGPPGVGKTAFVVRAAGAHKRPVAFVECRGTGPAPADAAELSDRLGRTAGARLVVLDDIADERQLPTLPAGPVVLTGRRPLPGLDVTRIALGPLPADESAAFLAAITGAPPDDVTRAVAEQCGHLPLALRIAGNRVAGRPGWTMAHLAGRLADDDRRLATLAAGDLSVEAALAPSFARLSDSALALCRRVALDHFDASDAARAADVDEAAARRGLLELVDHGLVTEADGAGRHRYHALVRTFARTANLYR